jgi:mRNA (2'-O-methyladenosine-N6-)-methyltransferase
LTNFDYVGFANSFKQISEGRLFDVIMIDPPWQLSSSNPTRGVKIDYSVLTDQVIQDCNIPALQTEGFIFIWAINSKMMTTLKFLKLWGYEYVDEVQWVKQTVTGKIAKGHAHYL